MRHRAKGDYDDISNYIPKDKPTISQREKRKNQAIVASLVLGATLVGTGTLLRYTLFADYFKSQDLVRPSAYARPTPLPAQIEEEKTLPIDMDAAAERRLRDRYFQGAPDEPSDSKAAAAKAAQSVDYTKGVIAQESTPYGNPVSVPSVAPPAPRPATLVPEVKVATTVPSVTPSLRPVDFPTPGAFQQTAPTVGNRPNAGNEPGVYTPSLPASPPPAGAGAGYNNGLPSSGVSSGTGAPSPGLPGSVPGPGSAPVPGSAPAPSTNPIP